MDIQVTNHDLKELEAITKKIVQAELERVEAEKVREIVEDARNVAEEAREKAEQARLIAEELREKFYKLLGEMDDK